MKILLINYRYFVSSGSERYMFNLKKLLEANRHDVVPFSITYAANEDSEYASYFAPPLAGLHEVYFRDHGHSLKAWRTTVERAFYSPTVYKHFSTLIDDVKPDVALVLHYLRKLSPSILKCLAERGIPFAVRLSDFAMLCPSAALYRQSAPCELCVNGSLRHSVRFRCVQGSVGASAINYLATRFHQRAGYFQLIPRFIVPSRFMVDKMIKGGWARDRLVHIPTFVPPVAPREPACKMSVPSIAYIGRLDPLKGVHILLDAVRLLVTSTESLEEFSVRIVGVGDSAYVERLRDFVQLNDLSMVQFDGYLGRDEIGQVLRHARCSVQPALSYENIPNAALESMAEGTPVVASGHGCFPELIQQESNGVLVAPGHPLELATSLRRFLTDPSYAYQMGERARRFTLEAHGADRHYRALMDLFQDLQMRRHSSAVNTMSATFVGE